MAKDKKPTKWVLFKYEYKGTAYMRYSHPRRLLFWLPDMFFWQLNGKLIPKSLRKELEASYQKTL